ncbi:MAG: MFS transporter [Candidatus Bipolaricaulota bacterium]
MIFRLAAPAVHISADGRRYLLATACLGFGSGLLYLFFNLYVLSLGYDRALVGLLAALPALVTALSAIPIGIVLPRLGFRRSLLLGTILLALALLAWASWPAAPVLVGAAVASGVGSVLLSVVSSPLMMSATPIGSRTRLFGLQFAVSTFASVAASLFGGFAARWLVEGGRPDRDGYRALLFVAAALTLAALLPLSRLRAVSQREDERLHVAAWRSHKHILAALFAVQLVGALGAGLTMPFLNVFFRLRFAVPDDLLGTVFALSSFLTGCAALASPGLARRFGRIRAVVASQLASIPLLLAMALVPGFAASAGCFLARTALMNMSSPIFAAFSMTVVPASVRPLAASLLMLAWNLGWALSAWVSGQLQGSIGFTPLFVLTAAFYVTASVMTAWFFGRGRDSAGEVSPAARSG